MTTNEMIDRANELADLIEEERDSGLTERFYALYAEFDSLTDEIADLIGRDAMCDAVRCPEV